MHYGLPANDVKLRLVPYHYKSKGFSDLILNSVKWEVVDGKTVISEIKLSKDSGFGWHANEIKGISTAFKIQKVAVDDIIDLITLDSKLAIIRENQMFYCENIILVSEAVRN